MATYNKVSSRGKFAHAFGVCAFPIFLRSLLVVFYEIPAWNLRLSAWDMFGTIAYTQVFALFESLLVFGSLLVLSLLLPARLFRRKFLATTTVVMLISSVWAVLVHFNDETIRLWGIGEFVLGGLLYVISIAVPYVLLQRYVRMEQFIERLAIRLNVLSALYVSFGLVSTVVVVFRAV